MSDYRWFISSFEKDSPKRYVTSCGIFRGKPFFTTDKENLSIMHFDHPLEAEMFMQEHGICGFEWEVRGEEIKTSWLDKIRNFFKRS